MTDLYRNKMCSCMLSRCMQSDYSPLTCDGLEVDGIEGLSLYTITTDTWTRTYKHVNCCMKRKGGQV